MKIEILRSRSKSGSWRWRTRSKGRIGVWSEAYHNYDDCLASIGSHQAHLASAEIEELAR